MPQETPLPDRRLVVARPTHQGQFFTEVLSDTVSLDMMLIPGGSFQMGQTAAEMDELRRQYGEEDYRNYFQRETPQHSVTVPLFFMGKYPITQAQWRAVAAYPPIDQPLDRSRHQQSIALSQVAAYPPIDQPLDPDPAHFKGDHRPVEKVKWQDVQEFCRRLSQHTGRTYRLPSEAEWEYACRAGTTTPFHYGETLSDELANYRAQDLENDSKIYPGVYGRGVYGQFRQATTEVGQFPPNAFGLYDMHGNVWEWCEDDGHDSYESAPEDSSAWIENDRSETNRVIRGGSWRDVPDHCRSAFRRHAAFGVYSYYIGFRVCCVPPELSPSASILTS